MCCSISNLQFPHFYNQETQAGGLHLINPPLISSPREEVLFVLKEKRKKKLFPSVEGNKIE